MNDEYKPFYKADGLKLIPILCLAFFIAFIPHLAYSYPLHADEWVLMALSRAMLKAGSATFPEPFLGSSTLSLSTNLEAGYQLLLICLQQVSGLAWEDLFRFFPALIAVLSTLGVYVLAQRLGFGWEAALLTALIPTSVGILGPAYLVPVAMGMFFLSLGLFIAFYLKNRVGYLLLFLIIVFLLAAHAPSALLLGLALTPYMLLGLKGDFKHTLRLGLALVLPFLLIFPWIFNLILPTAQALLQNVGSKNVEWLTTYTEIPVLIRSFGYVPLALCLLGSFVLAVEGGREKGGLVLGLVTLLTMLAVFFTLHYGVWIIYLRGLAFTQLLMAVAGGAGLMAVKNIVIPLADNRSALASLLHRIGYPLSLAVVAVMLYIAIPARLEGYHYQMIDGADYAAFKWIGQNVPERYGRAVLDPWKASPFVALTGKTVYSQMHATLTLSNIAAQTFLHNTSSDTPFLTANGITLVYSREPVLSYDLSEVRPHVFLLTR